MEQGNKKKIQYASIGSCCMLLHKISDKFPNVFKSILRINRRNYLKTLQQNRNKSRVDHHHMPQPLFPKNSLTLKSKRTKAKEKRKKF